MRLIMPAIYLALLQIAGDNIALLPDIAATTGPTIYTTAIIVYFILGAILTGLLAWVGVNTRAELPVVIRNIWGCRGKKIFAALTLAICLPSSAITGVIFAGHILQTLVPIPFWVAAIICITVFSCLSTGFNDCALKISNVVSLVFIPILLVTILVRNPLVSSVNIQMTGNIDWMLTFALLAYNVGGMRTVLMVEAGAFLHKKGTQVIHLTVIAKILEGVFTLLMIQSVVNGGAKAPMAMAGVFQQTFGNVGMYLFHIAVLCTFTNTMAPAMMVNARQLASYTGLSFWPSLIIAGCLIFIISFLDVTYILRFMSIVGATLMYLVFFLALRLHKVGNQQSV